MIVLDNPRPLLATARAEELSTRRLLTTLAAHRGKALLFEYDGRPVQTGYHVTEVKSGRFAALDCGASPESWTETFIQLWDVPAEPGRAFMAVDKFLAIMSKVAAEVPFDPDAKLTFEVSDPGSAKQLFKAAAIEADAAMVRVTLAPRPASCKPRDRWLDSGAAAPAPCCGPAKAAAAQCCG
jgi:hypothetical protein